MRRRPKAHAAVSAAFVLSGVCCRHAALLRPTPSPPCRPTPPLQIMNLALLVVSYGVSHRLFEFAWKGQLRALYPTPAAYQVRAAGEGCRRGICRHWWVAERSRRAATVANAHGTHGGAPPEGVPP